MADPKVKCEDGYLTVFFSLILTVMISLCLALLFGVKRNTGRMEGECITDVAMNSALAEFHRELLNQYNLFFVDSSYGTSYCSYRNIEEHLMEYAWKNLNADGVFMGKAFHNPSGLTLQDIEITGASVACDEGGAVLRRQAVDVMKQQIGLFYIQQVQSWFQTVEQYGLHTRNLLEEEQKVVKELQKWDETFSEDCLDQAATGTTIVAFWKSGVLYYVVDGLEISAQKITPKYYVSGRDRYCGTGMQPGVIFEDSFIDRLFFQEYILAYTGHYKQEKENGLLSYQTEYILAGGESDAENLEKVAEKLLVIRGAANMVSLLGDSTKRSAAQALGTLMAAALMVPELEKLFTALLEILWSMAEAIYDVAHLFRGKRIPLIKQDTDWYYSLEGLFSGVFLESWKDEADGDPGEGLSYEDYLRILLCLENEETITYRLMDIMEMDIRQTPGNQYFRMDGCVDGFRALFTYKDGNGDLLEIERNYGY